MKRLVSLLLALLVMVAAGAALATGLAPFEGLKDYVVDYDDMEGELWVEHTDVTALLVQAEQWPVLVTLKLSSYEESGAWYSMLQLYMGIDNALTEIEKVIIMVDGARYTFEGVMGQSPELNYSEVMLPCGTNGLEMLAAMSNTTGEVKARFSTSNGNLDFVMSDAQLKAIADLYHAFVASDLYDALYAVDIEGYYPVAVSGAPAPLAAGAEQAPDAPTNVVQGTPVGDGGYHLLFDIPAGSTQAQVEAEVQRQFGVALELNDTIGDGEEGIAGIDSPMTLETSYEGTLNLLGRPVDALFYIQHDKLIGAAVSVYGDEYIFANEDAGASAQARLGRVEEAVAYFDQLKAAYGAPTGGTLGAYADIVFTGDWSVYAEFNRQYLYEADPIAADGSLDGDLLREALAKYDNLDIKVEFGNVAAELGIGSMTPGQGFSIGLSLVYDYSSAPAGQAAAPAGGQAEASGGYTAAQQAEMEGYRTLSVGMRGEDVVRLKERMYELGYFKNPTNSNQYTETTAEYVNEFLKANGVANPDGTLSPQQQMLLYSDQAVQKPKPIKYERFAYKDVARSVQQYVGQRWKLTAYVIQQIDDPSSPDVELILSADRRGNQVIYAQVKNFKDAQWTGKVSQVTRLLERDKVEISCEILGEYSYETIDGVWLTVPLVNVEELKLFN